MESGTGAVPAGALQRRRLTLLALLALAGERGMSRERIQAFLWPESSAERARHALDQLLYATRRELGHAAILSAASDLRLNPAVVRADAVAFDEAVRDERWEEAAALYAGPLLDGVHLADAPELEQWLDAERLHRERDYHRALEALAARAAARGDRAATVHWWQRRAAAEPMSAPAALALMRALAAAGDRSGALQHARAYQQRVRVTLEVEPDGAVEALAAAIAADAGATQAAQHAPAPRVPPPVAADGLPTAAAPAPAITPPTPAPTTVPTPALPAVRRSARAGLAGAGALTVALAAVTAALLLPGRGRDGSPTVAAAARAPSASSRAAGRGTTDDEAHALYLRARTAWERRSKEGLEEAVVLYRRATERDPSYAAAHAGLAESYAMLGYFGFAPAEAMFPKAAAAARRAIALDSTVGGAYAALGQALAARHDWAEAERAYQRALALAPEDATAHQWYGLLLAYLGRSAEAALHTGHASRLDPLSVQINNMHGMMLYYAGDLAGALRQYERTVVAEPDSAWVRQNPWVLCNFARVAAAAGRHAQAEALLERALQVVPTHPRPLLDLAHVYVLAGEPARARAAYARADSTHPHFRVNRALLHALLGEHDAAFALLDRVDEWPLPSLVQLNGEPHLAAFRADPRYQSVRRRLRMPAR